MKQITLLSLLLSFSLSTFSIQKPNADTSKKFHCNCIRQTPKHITKDAWDLIKSYQKLFKQSPENCISSSKILTSFGIMTCPNYSSHGNGEVTFVSFQGGIDSLRTIWDSKPESYNYHRVCPPPEIKFPEGATSNDVFYLKFIPTKDYMTAPVKDITRIQGLPISKIKSIRCIIVFRKNNYPKLLN